MKLMNPQTKRKSVVGEKSDCNPASVKHWGTKKARGISSSSCRPGHLSLSLVQIESALESSRRKV